MHLNVSAECDRTVSARELPGSPLKSFGKNKTNQKTSVLPPAALRLPAELLQFWDHHVPVLFLFSFQDLLRELFWLCLDPGPVPDVLPAKRGLGMDKTRPHHHSLPSSSCWQRVRSSSSFLWSL